MNLLRTLAPGKIPVALLGLLLVFMPACNEEKTKAQKTVEDYLKSFGVKSVALDRFLTLSDVPDRAYVSVTATWNYANSAGELQKEYLGYLLTKEGGAWKIQGTAPYTKDAEKASDILRGKNIKERPSPGASK